jgi:hypothetical protein
VEKNTQALADWLKRIYEDGIEPAQLLRDLRLALEESYLERLGLPDARGRSGGRSQPALSLPPEAGPEILSFLLRRVNRILEELRWGDSPRLVLELGLFGCLEAAQDLGGWVERLEVLERKLSSGKLSAQASPPAFLCPDAAGRAQGNAVAASGESVPLPTDPPGGSPGEGEAWSRLIEVLRREKGALAATLEDACLLCPTPGAWVLRFKRTFDLEQAKRNLPHIVAILATEAGREIALSLEVGESGESSPSEAIDRGIVAGPGGIPEGGTWADVTQGSAQAVTPLDKAREILGGKLKVVRKAR